MHRAQADVRTLRTKRRKNTHTRKLLWRWFLLISGLVFVFFGASWLSFYTPLQLEKVVLIGINPAARVETRAAEAAVARVFADAGERLVSPTSAFFYPRRMILENIASSSPHVAEVSAARGGRLLIIAVAEREPFARWCAAEEPKCLFIDEAGLAFVAALGDTAPASPLTFTGGEPLAGAHLLPEAEFTLLGETLAAAERIGFAVGGVSRGEGRDFSFLLTDGSAVRFVLSPDAPALFMRLPETLAAARLSIAGGAVAPPLQYVDLRFAEQVVFKRK